MRTTPNLLPEVDFIQCDVPTLDQDFDPDELEQPEFYPDEIERISYEH